MSKTSCLLNGERRYLEFVEDTLPNEELLNHTNNGHYGVTVMAYTDEECETEPDTHILAYGQQLPYNYRELPSEDAHKALIQTLTKDGYENLCW